MSRLSRLLLPIAAARRSYSIFSSKPGGGRYFNSAKSSKVIAPSTSKAAPTPSANANNAGSSSSVPEVSDSNQAEEMASPSSPQQPTSETRRVLTSHSALSPTTFSPSVDFTPVPPHPPLKPNELVLHRFFALHRPCLLLNQPTTSLFESAPTTTMSSPGGAPPPASLGTIDDPPMATPEADADAARQLSRALVMNRVGNLTDWEDALARFGLQEVKEPAPPVPAGISMDSTKRKRRKKMKKHKYVLFPEVELTCD